MTKPWLEYLKISRSISHNLPIGVEVRYSFYEKPLWMILFEFEYLKTKDSRDETIEEIDTSNNSVNVVLFKFDSFFIIINKC